MPEPVGTLIDAGVHPQPTSRNELLEFVSSAWRDRAFPAPERYFYPPPLQEMIVSEAEATNPATTAARLAAAGVEQAILLPLTRGLLPNTRLADEICSATNRWLAERWLSDAHQVDYRGSIRVNPLDPEAALSEIDRWARSARFVQIAVPLQSLEPYGHSRFLPVWQAAADRGLPVCVHSDGGAGVEFAPTLVGYPTHFVEYATLQPLNFVFHLFSLIAEGVFERIPELQFVFGDGGLDLLAPMMWRLDKDWRPSRYEVPWLQREPSEYLDRIHFWASSFEGPAAGEQRAQWLKSAGASEFWLYASAHPFRGGLGAESLTGLDDASRAAVMRGNARSLYQLGEATSGELV